MIDLDEWKKFKEWRKAWLDRIKAMPDFKAAEDQLQKMREEQKAPEGLLDVFKDMDKIHEIVDYLRDKLAVVPEETVENFFNWRIGAYEGQG